MLPCLKSDTLNTSNCYITHMENFVNIQVTLSGTTVTIEIKIKRVINASDCNTTIIQVTFY